MQPCYNGDGTDNPGTCPGTGINNPYYSSAPQPLLDRNAWYETYPNEFPFQPIGGETTAIAPNVFSGYLNYKHDRLVITPTFQLNQGNTYGNPLAIDGIDPRFCGGNQANTATNPYTGSTFGPVPGSTTPNNANYLACGPTLATGNGFLAIPNPQTGQFDSLGKYREPWQFNLGVQASYDISNKVKANFILSNLVNQCFGGSKTPWSDQFKAGHLVCGYNTNGNFYQSNFYNGSGPNDPVNPSLSPVLQQPYAAYGGNLPFNAYFNLQIKL